MDTRQRLHAPDAWHGFASGPAGRPLDSLDQFDLDATRLVGNIENLVGSVAIPVGLAGPLLFRGEHATGWITAPFATTEGALVASATRGAHAISRSGGVATRVLGQRMVRSPRFDLEDVVSAHSFAEWATRQRDALPERSPMFLSTPDWWPSGPSRSDAVWISYSSTRPVTHRART